MERTTLFGKNRVEFWACNDSESFATIRVTTIADRKKETDLVRLEPYEIRKMEIQKNNVLCVVLEHRHFIYIR